MALWFSHEPTITHPKYDCNRFFQGDKQPIKHWDYNSSPMTALIRLTPAEEASSLSILKAPSSLVFLA